MVSCPYPSTGCQANRWHLPSPAHHFSSEDYSSMRLKRAQIPTPKTQFKAPTPRPPKMRKNEKKNITLGEKYSLLNLIPGTHFQLSQLKHWQAKSLQQRDLNCNIPGHCASTSTGRLRMPQILIKFDPFCLHWGFSPLTVHGAE